MFRKHLLENYKSLNYLESNTKSIDKGIILVLNKELTT